MVRHNDVLGSVSSFYAKALNICRGKGGGLEQAGCCSIDNATVLLAELAGYGARDLQGLPENLATESFGCGNPLSFADVQPGQTVLDLGSGAGLDLVIAAQQVGPSGRAIGVDMTPAMIDRARTNLAQAGLTNAEVREGRIEALPVEDESVDWVISNCVINLSVHKDQVFSEIVRVLRPGGRMAISDLCVQDLPRWMFEYDQLHAACVTGAVPERDYVDRLRRAGLENVQVVGRMVYDIAQIGAVLEHMLGDGQGRLLGGALSSSHLARALQGRISSVRFAASKPAAGSTRSATAS